MTRAKKGDGRRTRRSFGPEFKMEAVRRVQERRAQGVTLAQIGRELDVRPDLLRAWARHPACSAMRRVGTTLAPALAPAQPPGQ